MGTGPWAQYLASERLCVGSYTVCDTDRCACMCVFLHVCACMRVFLHACVPACVCACMWDSVPCHISIKLTVDRECCRKDKINLLVS